MLTSNTVALLLPAASILFTAAHAQNSSCAGTFRPFKTVNSTGQHEFTWNSSYATNDPWYVSALVGSRGDVHDITALAYISVPGNVPNDTGICTYQFTNINATLEASGKDSCNGVISSACIDYLTGALDESANGCPDGNSGEAFDKACPMLNGNSARSTSFIDVTNGTCAYDNMPEVEIPKDYNTFAAPSGLDGFKNGRTSVESDQVYDILTRQTIPLVLLGQFMDPKGSGKAERTVQFVCMNANKTVEGSRVPEKEKPWENAGTGVRTARAGWVAAFLTVVVLVL